MPGTPFNDEKLTEAQRALLDAKYGLDASPLTRFFNYLKLAIFEGDFGVSYAIQKDMPVSTLISGRSVDNDSYWVTSRFTGNNYWTIIRISSSSSS